MCVCAYAFVACKYKQTRNNKTQSVGDESAKRILIFIATRVTDLISIVATRRAMEKPNMDKTFGRYQSGKSILLEE